MFRLKYCPYPEVSPLHSPLSVVQQKTHRGCPLQHDIGWEQMRRARAVISSCVRRKQDKGWQDTRQRREDGNRQWDVCMCVHGKGESRPFQKLAGSFTSPFHFYLWFHWGSELFNVTGVTPVLKCDAGCQQWNGGQHNVVLFFPACTFLWCEEQKLCFKRETESN